VHAKSVTIRDVAQLAKVSESTVSRVLSEATTTVSISQETRQRVLSAAGELSYQPHRFARALRGKGTRLLGLIVREIDDPFFASLTEVISSVANEEGFQVVLGYANSDPAEALALSEIPDFRHTDGLLLLGDLRESSEDHRFLATIAEDRWVVSVCRGSQEIVGGIPSVAVDNRVGASMALEYLHQLGHQRIATIHAGRTGDLKERYEAYCEFMSARPSEEMGKYIQVDENSYEGGYRATKNLLSLAHPPTAIFATDDTMAIGVLSAAADMGRVVPRDVSVIGFDDIKIAAYLRPALTTVRQPIDQIGRQSVDLLIEMIRKEMLGNPLPRILVKPELVIRDSCAPPRTDAVLSQPRP